MANIIKGRKLTIGPTCRSAVNRDHIIDVWHQCDRSYGMPIKFDDICPVEWIHEESHGIAFALIDANSPSNCTIGVNWDVFGPRSTRQQELSLLHECIHLSFMTDGLRDHTLQGYKWRAACSHLSETLVDLAYGVWNRVQEITAELYLQSLYEALRSDRVAYLNDLASTSALGDNGPYRSIRALVQLLQVDLLERVATGVSQACQSNAQRMARALETAALSDNLIPQAEVSALRDALSRITVEPPNFESNACEPVVNHILKLPSQPIKS